MTTQIALSDAGKVLDELANLQLFKTALGDETSFVVHSHWVPGEARQTLYFSPEAVTLFAGWLDGRTQAKAASLPDGASIFCATAWP